MLLEMQIRIQNHDLNALSALVGVLFILRYRSVTGSGMDT